MLWHEMTQYTIQALYLCYGHIIFIIICYVTHCQTTQYTKQALSVLWLHDLSPHMLCYQFSNITIYNTGSSVTHFQTTQFELGLAMPVIDGATQPTMLTILPSQHTCMQSLNQVLLLSRDGWSELNMKLTQPSWCWNWG